MTVQRLVDRLRVMARDEAKLASPSRRYFVVIDGNPLTARDTVSGTEYDEDEDNFDLSGYAAFYHQNVGLAEGDLLLVHPVDAEGGEPIWVATSVTTDKAHPRMPAP